VRSRRTRIFHGAAVTIGSNLKAGNILTKATALIVNLRIHGAPIASRSQVVRLVPKLPVAITVNTFFLHFRVKKIVKNRKEGLKKTKQKRTFFCNSQLM
jgi:hypothetical protein